MTIRKLSGEVKAFIVRSLACFDTPSTVAEAVERQFGETVTRQVVQCYNPHWRAGAKLSQQWRQLFEDTRKAFVEETNKIGISHRNVRLRKLDQQVALAEERGDVATIARLLRLAEMEMRPYTRRGELRGAAAAPVEHHPPVSDRELAKAILVKLAKAKAEAEAEQRSETRDRKPEIGDQGSQAGRRSEANGPKGGVAETRNQKPETRGQISQSPEPELGRRSEAISPKDGPAVFLNSEAKHPDDHREDWMAEFLTSDD